jgi:hypothetical protein
VGSTSFAQTFFLFQPGHLTEVRFFSGRGGPILSLFTDDPTEIDEAVRHPAVAGLNAYMLLNELKADTPERHGVARHTLFSATQGQTTSDNDIERRRWLLLDSDSVKPAGAAATEAQRAATHAHSEALELALTAEGWPLPVVCDSGNGFHRLYSLDLPNTPEVTFLLSNFLHLAARKFDTAEVKLDKGVGNAARVTRLYGTRNQKAGRDSAVLRVPDPIVPVTPEQIQALVTKWRGALGYKKPLARRTGDWTPERMEKFMDFHHIDYRPPVQKAHGLLWVLTPCPFNVDHTGSSPALFLTKEGWPKFCCLHNSCAGMSWREFRRRIHLLTGKWFV